MSEWITPDTDMEKLDWLRLIRSENVGPATFFTLMSRYENAAAALDALPGLATRGGMKRKIKLADASATEQEMEIVEAGGARFVFRGDLEFSPLLAATDHGPPVICVRGDAKVACRPTVGMVGARNASAAGRKIARTMASDLGARGYAVASGLARGIDTAAHEGALETGTIAVMAGGADYVYPPQNQKLYEQILETGCIISEMPWGTTPQARHFPRRNRIVSGLSLGVVVVEAALRSGSLITARYALEQNREVFSVPGSPLDTRSAGSNKLIQDGAKLIQSTEDVIHQLDQFPLVAAGGFLPEQFKFEEPSEEDLPQSLRDEIFGLLSHAPVSLDDLARETRQPVGQVQAILLELEIAGSIVRQSGTGFKLAD